MAVDDPRLDRVATRVALAASAAFVVLTAWELTGPFDAGHDAATTAVGIAALNAWRWGILAPVTHFTAAPPLVGDYYCHHPWGIFWTTALLVRVLGAHDWVLRLAPLGMSAATPPLVFVASRRLWGAPAAAVAAVAFTVTPIALAFADFNALEVPVMFGVALGIWGLVRFTDGWRWRWLAVALGGLVHAMNSDWAAFVFVGSVLGAGLLRLAPPVARRRPPLPSRAALAGALLALAAALVGGAYVVLFSSLGRLDDLLAQGAARAHGASTPLAAVLVARRHWLELCFTPVGIALGVLALPCLVVRALGPGRALEALPLAVLVMATLQYVVFKNGADVHVFWPHYFALYLAYGAGALVATLRGGLEALPGPGAKGRWPRTAGRAAFVVGLAPLLVMAPDALATLTYARRTGKRFDDGWRRITQGGDQHAVVREVTGRLAPAAAVGVHRSVHLDWALEWSARRPILPFASPFDPVDLLLVDARFAAPEILAHVASTAAVTAYGPFWVVEGGRGPQPIVAQRITRTEPGPWRWYWVDGSDPSFGFAPDPFGTWELRHHLGQAPNPAPAAAPASAEELRVAHAMALAAGDGVAAERHLAALLERLDQRPRTVFADGTELLGFALVPGVAPLLRLYVRAGASPGGWDRELRVVSRVDRRPGSTVAPPRRDREVGLPFALPAALWRPHHVYVAESEIRRQPGVDAYSTELVGKDPRLPGPSAARTPLFVLHCGRNSFLPSDGS